MNSHGLTEQEKQFYRPDEVAEQLRVSVSYVYWLVRHGRIKAVRIGRLIRIPREEFCRMCSPVHT